MSKQEFVDHFTPDHLDTLNYYANIEVPAYKRGEDWEANREHYRLRMARDTANQELSVFSKREALDKMAQMLEELDLSAVKQKIQDIIDFADEHGIDHMVDLDTYDVGNALFQLVDHSPDVHGSAMAWMRSNHDC